MNLLEGRTNLRELSRSLRIQNSREALSSGRRTGSGLTKVTIVHFLRRSQQMLFDSTSLARDVLVLTHLSGSLEHTGMPVLVVNEQLGHGGSHQLVEDVELH